MATTYRIQISISPLSVPEIDRVLAAVRACWLSPSCVHRQPIDEAWLLVLRHETELRASETPEWFAERLVAMIWQSIGRYVRIAFDMAPHEAPDGRVTVFDEDAYWRILRSFRLAPHLR
jgi:hypothetical protein